MAAQVLGPSRGGFSTKMIAVARDAVGVLRKKGFDSAVLDSLDALPLIPDRSYPEGPWLCDDEMRETYEPRSRVERGFPKQMQVRRMCEKPTDVCLGRVRLVLGSIHDRKLAQVVSTPWRPTRPGRPRGESRMSGEFPEIPTAASRIISCGPYDRRAPRIPE